MVDNRIGQMLRESRETMGCTQEQVAEEICDVSTVSRIENGTQSPSIQLAASLFDRLQVIGYPTVMLHDFLNRGCASIQQDILAALALGETDRIDEYLMAMKGFLAEGGQVLRQFYDTVMIARQVLYLQKTGRSMEEAAKELSVGPSLEQILRMTRPDLDYRKIRPADAGNLALNNTEFMLLNALALLDFSQGKRKVGIRLMAALHQEAARDTRRDGAYFRRLCGLTINLARMELMMGFLTECEAHQKTACDLACRSGSLGFHIRILLLRKEVYEARGDLDDYNNVVCFLHRIYLYIPPRHRNASSFNQFLDRSPFVLIFR